MAFINHRKLSEVSNEKLIEARERADAGHRIAFPQLYEELGGESPPDANRSPAEIDHKTATEVGTNLLDARNALMDAGLALPLGGQIDLHLGLNGLINEIDRITGELADRWGSE